MKKLLVALSGLIAAVAIAQSVPNGGVVTQGEKWTAQQWNLAWHSKADTAGVVAPSGTLLPTILSYNPLGWSLYTASDNAADLTGNGTNIPALFVVDELFGGPNVNDGRNALSVFQDLKVATSPTNAYRYYVAINGIAQAEVNDSGTGGSPKGVIEAVTGSAHQTTGATNYFAQIGAEFTVSADAGSSVANKALLLLDEWPTDAVHGSSTDAFIWNEAHTGAVGMNTWAQLDCFAGACPLSTSATLLRLIGTNTIFNGIDFGSLAITSNVLQWNAATYYLSGAGNANLAQGTFTAASGVGLAANGVAGQYAAQVSNNAATGTSFGLKVNAGTNASDFAVVVQGKGGSPSLFLVRGDGVAIDAIFTIAALPTCNGSTAGGHATVSNGVASPAYMATVSTTGAVTDPVFCNGTNWVYH